MPDSEAFTSSRNNPYITTNQELLRSSMTIDGEIFFEANLSANGIAERMIKIAEYCGIDPSAIQVYLREDRDAGAG